MLAHSLGWGRWLAVVLLLASRLSAGEPAGRELPPGTLLFLENCNSVVETTTRGRIGHVAIVLPEAGVSWVYEATPAKVRRLTVAAYYDELGRLNQRRDQDEAIRLWALAPLAPYEPRELEAMQAFLDEQLGRRYSVKNYVRGKSYDGIHCAELASRALNASGRFAFEDCHRISPQALYTAVVPSHAAARRIDVPPPAAKEPWCQRAQRRTAEYFAWCGWSLQEAWLFLW